MFDHLFKPAARRAPLGTQAERAAVEIERASSLEARRRASQSHEECRAALLQAGGAELDHPPGYQDLKETAIRRLVQTGELREHIDYSRFPRPAAYRYLLTPRGQKAAAALAIQAV